MAKSNLYTGTGDTGLTSLVTGQRVNKECQRLEAYGTLDELSSHLGSIIACTDCPTDDRHTLLQVQNLLFDLGAYLATLPQPGTKPNVARLTPNHITAIETRIDTLDTLTPTLRCFILPGGTPLAATTHIARTVCRRAERRIISLSRNEYVDPQLIKYINRLSDYLFILARYINHLAGVEDTPWKKTDSTQKTLARNHAHH